MNIEERMDALEYVVEALIIATLGKADHQLVADFRDELHRVRHAENVPGLDAWSERVRDAVGRGFT